MATTIQPPVSQPLSGPDQPASRPDAAGSPDPITILDPRDGTLVGRLEPTGRAGIRALVKVVHIGLPGPAAPGIPA